MVLDPSFPILAQLASAETQVGLHGVPARQTWRDATLSCNGVFNMGSSELRNLQAQRLDAFWLLGSSKCSTCEPHGEPDWVPVSGVLQASLVHPKTYILDCNIPFSQ